MRILWCSLVLLLCLGLLVAAGCARKKRVVEEEASESTKAAAPAAAQAGSPASPATTREPGPNVGLSGIGRFWTEQEVKNNLRNLGIAYNNYMAEHGKGPPDQKTLSSFY